MKTRGPSVNAPMRRPGSAVDDAADLERLRADQHLVADREIELRQQFRPHEHAVALQQRVRVASVAQRQLP